MPECNFVRATQNSTSARTSQCHVAMDVLHCGMVAWSGDMPQCHCRGDGGCSSRKRDYTEGLNPSASGRMERLSPLHC